MLYLLTHKTPHKSELKFLTESMGIGSTALKSLFTHCKGLEMSSQILLFTHCKGLEMTSCNLLRL